LNSPAVDSKKFIKLDVKNYPVVRDLHCFDQFEKELTEQASIDDIQDVFDSKYHPSSLEENVISMRRKSLLCQFWFILCRIRSCALLSNDIIMEVLPKVVGKRFSKLLNI